jgi:hypothetical protein
MMQIILNPKNWTKLTARTLCHEPTQTLFIVYSRLSAMWDDALPERLGTHAYPISDNAPLPCEPMLSALKIEAILMLLLFHGIIAHVPPTPAVRSEETRLVRKAEHRCKMTSSNLGNGNGFQSVSIIGNGSVR